MSNIDWAATPSRSRSEAEPDVNRVFSNFKNARPARAMNEADARERNRRKGGDRMQGVVVEVRKARSARPEADETASSVFRF